MIAAHVGPSLVQNGYPGHRGFNDVERFIGVGRVHHGNAIRLRSISYYFGCDRVLNGEHQGWFEQGRGIWKRPFAFAIGSFFDSAIASSIA